MMIIRPATVDDLECLSGLFAEFFLEDGIPTPPDAIEMNLERMIADPRACLFLGEIDGAIAGFSSGIITFGVEFGCAAELEDLYITPRCRGRGLARHLASAVLGWAEGQGATETILVITPQAEKKQGLTKFYEKLGFRRSDRLVVYKASEMIRIDRWRFIAPAGVPRNNCTSGRLLSPSLFLPPQSLTRAGPLG